MEKVKKIDWKNVLERALWTFAEGFVVALPATLSMEISGATWKSILFGALMSGVSALKTCILDLIKQHNEQYVEDEVECEPDYIEELLDEDLEDVFPEEGEETKDDEGDAEK